MAGRDRTILLLLTIVSSGVLGAVKELDQDWWKHVITYQIYPRSFQDSDGDGIGDLKGIESRLEYFEDLGVEAIWLSPIYTSPMADFGYDVADYKDIDPVFGNMAHFDDLIKAIHDRGMYLIMDFIPNHTSDLHQWFLESRRGGEDNKYTDYYRWHPGRVPADGTRVPPNNWLSIFGGSAWEWDDEREAYYLHQFVEEQPDLNYRNPAVRADIEDSLRFWVEKGVDGFRIDAIGTMYEVDDVSLDEPINPETDAQPFQHDYLLHPYTMDQPEIHDVISQWRRMFDEYEAKTGRHTFMVMEIYDKTQKESMKYYHSGADMPFNFNLMYMNTTCGGRCTHDLVKLWFDNMPTGKWPNFVIGNHDNARVTTRKGSVYVNALNMLILTLPGSPTTYYGEELGMEDIFVSYEEAQDPWAVNMGPELYMKYNRDVARAPMQWSNSKHAGFSDSENTWLPVNPDYVTRNVQDQKMQVKSPLQIYSRLAQLRRSPAFRDTDIQFHIINDNIMSYIRHQPGTDAHLVIVNLGNDVSTDSYDVTIGDDIINVGRVVVDTGCVNTGLEEGNEIDLSDITLGPGGGLVIRLSMEVMKSDRDEL